jgi:hypothetical protein
MRKNGKRLLALLIYQKLKKDLADQDETLGIAKAKRLLIEAIALHPDLSIDSLPELGSSQIRSTDGGEAIINLQSAIDSLMILWNEHLRAVEANPSGDRR